MPSEVQERRTSQRPKKRKRKKRNQEPPRPRRPCPPRYLELSVLAGAPSWTANFSAWDHCPTTRFTMERALKPMIHSSPLESTPRPRDPPKPRASAVATVGPNQTKGLKPTTGPRVELLPVALQSYAPGTSCVRFPWRRGRSRLPLRTWIALAVCVCIELDLMCVKVQNMYHNDVYTWAEESGPGIGRE
jgi:hypothetical protein